MWIKILLLFFAFSFIFRTDHSFDQDLGRHIKLGEIIVNTLQVPKTNLFSYTYSDYPFVNTHWLFGVIAYLFSISLGLQTFLFLKIIIFLFSIFIVLKLIPNQNKFLLPIGLIFLYILRERLELRPEIFSFLYTAVTLFILEKYLNTKTKLIYILPFIQLLWINTHIYFFVGFVLQGIFLLHLMYSVLKNKLDVSKLKILSLIFLISLTASLVNPNGIKGLLYPLTVNQNYGYTIVENQTMFLLESIDFRNPNFIFVKIAFGIIALSFLINLIKRKVEIKNLLLIFFGLFLALLNVRGFPYLFFISFPAILYNFSYISIPKFKIIGSLNFIFVIFLLLSSFSYLSGEYYKKSDSPNIVKLELTESMKNGMDFVIANDLPNPIFNNFDIGSYIAYRGYPKYKVFVDGRPEAYPKEFFTDIYIPMQYDYSKFKLEEKNHKLKTVIFSHTDQTPWGQTFLKSIVKDESWKLVYLDDFMIILVINEIAIQKNLELIDLSKISAQNYNFNNYISYLRIANFLLNTGNTNSIKEFIQSAYKLNPKSPIVNSFIRNL